jgi:hypothetical protein
VKYDGESAGRQGAGDDCVALSYGEKPQRSWSVQATLDFVAKQPDTTLRTQRRSSVGG